MLTDSEFATIRQGQLARLEAIRAHPIAWGALNDKAQALVNAALQSMRADLVELGVR